MFLTDKIKSEIGYFKKLHENFSITLGDKTIPLSKASEEVLYMLFSASLIMEISEDELFESFIISDKSLTGKAEILIDAYAFIDTENTNEKQLHIFQFKTHNNMKSYKDHSASPKEVYEFFTYINNEFLHPELNESSSSNKTLDEIKNIRNNFLNKNRKNKISYYCNFITDCVGIPEKPAETFSFLNRFDSDKKMYGFETQVIGIRELEDLADYGKINIGTEILEVDRDSDTAYRYEDNSGKVELGMPGKIFIGMINVNELINLQNKYHNNQLYSENVRLYLGDRGNVNKDIIETITSEKSQWFPYMNNGISVICDEMKMGTPNPSSKKLSLSLKNMQIINGCQTVNALYSAKYNERTKNDFKSSKVLIKIYQIDPSQVNFKFSIIRATNNQNAVKTYSLVANDPIQIKIQEKLKVLNFIYDRKGEARQVENSSLRFVRMVEATTAYSAVYLLKARELRSGVSKGRLFRDEEYKKIFKTEYLEDDSELTLFSVRILISSILLNKMRTLITENIENYIKRLNIFKKSLYYLAGLYYCVYVAEISELEKQLCSLIAENNPNKIRSDKSLSNFERKVEVNFDSLMEKFIEFYNNLNMDKTDIDNLLKSATFRNSFMSIEDVKKIYEKPLD